MFLGICPIYYMYMKNGRLLRKSACAYWQVKTKMYLTESLFIKISLAMASGQVLMLVPAPF